jgi:hypothetical protein
MLREELEANSAPLDQLLSPIKPQTGRERGMNKLALKTEGDTHVVVTRRLAAAPESVYRAHTDATIVQRWKLGPDGWTMPVCRSDARPESPPSHLVGPILPCATDPAGLCKWLAKDRCIVTLGTSSQLKRLSPALEALVRDWIKWV